MYKQNCKWHIGWRGTQNLPSNFFFYLLKPDNFTVHAYMIQNTPKKIMPSLSRFSRNSTELQLILLYRISPTSGNKYGKHGQIYYAPPPKKKSSFHCANFHGIHHHSINFCAHSAHIRYRLSYKSDEKGRKYGQNITYALKVQLSPNPFPWNLHLPNGITWRSHRLSAKMVRKYGKCG